MRVPLASPKRSDNARYIIAARAIERRVSRRTSNEIRSTATLYKRRANDTESSAAIKGRIKALDSDGSSCIRREIKPKFTIQIKRSQKKVLIGAPMIPICGIPIKMYAVTIFKTEPIAIERIGKPAFE